MKKSLLIAAGFAMAFGASAQVEVGFTDSEALGLAGKPTLEASTVLSQTENVTMTNTLGDAVSAQNPDFAGFKYIVVNGEYIKLVQGIGGSTNGTGNLESQPGGWGYNFEVKADGYLIVVSKISSNKNFYAFEGKAGEGAQPISYTLGMDIQDATNYPDINQVVYTLPADDMGYVDLASADIDKYTFGVNTVAWPIRIGTGNAEATTAGNGTGMMMFPVYAEAGNYITLATGSKMNTCGYVFVPGNPAEMAVPEVSIYAPVGDSMETETWRVFTGEQPAAPGELGGIADIIADQNNADAPMFNVLGQKVDASYKGLVIKNGQKFINR